MSSAAERWIAERADAAEIDGEMIHATVTVDLDIDSVVTVRRITANQERRQGLVLDADEPLQVGDTTATRVVLWSDTAPEEVRLEASAGRLTVWNVWDEDGATHAWIGSAGIRRQAMEADGHDAGARLLASDGHPPSSTDLEIELAIDGAS